MYEPGIVGDVAERRTQLADAIREASVEVDVCAVVPEMRAHLLSCDQISRPGYQQRERSRGLRLERHGTIRSREGAGPIVELEDPEPVCHLTGR